MIEEGAARLGRLGRGFITVALGNYGALVLSFAISIALTNRLGAERYGGLALLLMVSQLLALFASNWTHIGFVGFGSREYASQGTVLEAMWTRHWIVLPWALLGAVVLLVFQGPLATYLEIPPAGLALLFAHFVAAYLLATFGAAFQAKEQMGRYGLALFLDKGLAFVLIVSLPLAWIDSPLRIVALYAISASLVSLWCLRSLGWSAVRPRFVPRPAFGRMWRFSMPLIFSTWSGVLGTNWLDFVVIRHYLPLADLGQYALATQLNGVLQQVTIIFSTLLLPRFNVMAEKQDHDGIQTFVVRILPYWFLGSSLLFGLALFVIRPVIPLVFGAEFVATARPLAILMIATIALTFFNAFTPILSAYGLTWHIALICMASALLNVGMNFVLIPRFGLDGSAIATVLAYLLSAGGVLILVRARYGYPVLRMIPLAAPVLVAAGLFLVLDGLVFYTLGPLACLAAAGLMALRFGLFRRENVHFLLSRSAVASPSEPVNIG